MATTTISGSGTRNNKGTVFGAGNVASSLFRTSSQITNGIAHKMSIRPYSHWDTGIQSALVGSAVSITSITQSGSTGFAAITKSSHGLAVGDLLVVYGVTPSHYNKIHRVTAVTSSSEVKTDVLYTSDSTVHGSYKPFSGHFAKMTEGRYVGKIIGNYVAGNTSSRLRIPAGDFYRFPIPVSKGNYRYDNTSWDYETGALTKGANAGAALQFIDPTGGGAVSSEALPSRAVPGEFVIHEGKALPSKKDYPARTE